METYMWIIWLSLFVIMIVLEASGPGLISIWFAVGAIVAMIVSFSPNVPWWVETIVFVVVSIASVFGLRPLLKKYTRKSEITQTNIDSFVGKNGYVIEDIAFLKPGAVKIGDVSWTAVPLDKNEVIKENDIIEVVSINGNKLIVKKVEEK